MTTPGFQVDFSRFNKFVNERAIVFGRERDVEVKAQARLLSRELIQRTPPLDGKVIAKILDARGQSFRNPEAEQLKARAIGERAVERDRRKKAVGSGMSREERDADVKLHQAHVGRAKAGWTPSFVKSGGKAPSSGGWIGRHGNGQGYVVSIVDKDKILFEMVNTSSWASLSETARIVRESVARRERAMENQIKRALEKTFGRGAGAAYR